MTEGVVQIDRELCTGCGNCVATCPSEAIHGERGQPHSVSEERCLTCGRCVQVCNAYDSLFQDYPSSRTERLRQRELPANLQEPLFAARDRCALGAVKAALADPARVAVVQCGPTVCMALAEDFGLPPGSLPPGRVIAALRKMGLRKVYSFGLPATLAVLEEAQELAERLQSGRILPVINSSCPASVKAIEQFYPELIHYLASAKSPHQIAGTLLKSYVAAKLALEPATVYSVSVGPCTSRKFEAVRPEMSSGGRPDIDAVLTTRELAYLIKEFGIDLETLAEEEFDDELPAVAGTDGVYCAPGDITEAVLRTAHGLLTQGQGGTREVALADTGSEGVRVTSVQLNGFEVKAAAIAGWQNAVPILETIKSGKSEFAFVEVLACPMGCVSGGGQPKVLLPQDRSAAYNERARLATETGARDWEGAAQLSAVQQVYRGFFGKACGDKSNRALHTQYQERRLEGKLSN